MPDILATIDHALSLCPCGAEPRPDSAYCSYDCEPTHISSDTNTNGPGEVSWHGIATPMRWRPDLLTEHDDTGLEPVTQQRRGPYQATTYRRDNDRLHLRLDDGHRFVGLDVDQRDDGAIEAVWVRLEQELGDARHAVPDDDPWPELGAPPRPSGATLPWRRCHTCGQRGTPRPGRRPILTEIDIMNVGMPGYEFPSPLDVEDCQLCRHCRTPYPGPPIDQPVEITATARQSIAAGQMVTADMIRPPQPAPWISGNLSRLTGVPVFVDPDLPADAVEIRDRDTDRPRIHVGRPDFTPTPEVETFLRERHEQMERRASRLLQQWRATEALLAQIPDPTAWIRVTGTT